MKLSDREWKAFNVTDIFDHIQRGKRLKNADHIPGNMPYVSSSALNNGVADWIKPTDKSRVFGESISLANSGSVGTAFYEPFQYVASDHITSFHLKNGSKLVYLFMATCLEKQKHNFGFNREVNEDRLKRLRLMLPINNQGQPDYQFMADYERELIQHKRARYSIYAQKQLDRIGDIADVEPLSKKQWDVFRIDQLFDSITRPSARSKNQYDNGDVPFIASSAILNGAVKFCTPHVGEKLDESNCITVSPVDGSSFYQTTDFLGRGGGGSSIIMLRSSKINQYSGMFVARAIHNTTSKYQYGHMATSNGITRDQIMLPVNDKGEPDYDYMEQYVKNLMIKKYQSYLDYVKQH